MRRVMFLWCLSVICAAAQSFEVGVTAGGGTFGAEDISMTAYGVVGVETCVLWSRGFGVFGEYSHWERGRDGLRSSQISRVDTLAAGVRMQRGRSVRPFFDIGIAGAWDEYEVYLYPGSMRHGNAGLTFGGGVGFPIRGGWRIRPQARVIVLRGHAGAMAGAAISYTFPRR